MLWPRCLDLSIQPHPGRNALAVTLCCHALTCQQGALHKTILGKLGLLSLRAVVQDTVEYPSQEISMG